MSAPAERLAAALSDYLALRQEPEPVMVPQRDSVRAELAGVGTEGPER